MGGNSYPQTVNLSSPCRLQLQFFSAGETSSDADAAAADGSAAVGGAMGMLTSLTSVVQSTVSNRVLFSLCSVADGKPRFHTILSHKLFEFRLKSQQLWQHMVKLLSWF